MSVFREWRPQRLALVLTALALELEKKKTLTILSAAA